MKRKGFTLIELLVVIAIIALLMGFLMPALNEARNLALQLVCRSNMSGLGKTMEMYAADNEGTFPRAGGEGSIWTDADQLTDWLDMMGNLMGQPIDYDYIFGPPQPPNGRKATITSSLYLLVKYYSVKPAQFVCKSDGARKFEISKTEAGQSGLTLEQVWDFGGFTSLWPYIPGQCVSYAYHMPYDVPNPLRTTPVDPAFVSFCVIDQFNPGSPVLADRNPHLDAKLVDQRPLPTDQPSAAHQGKGQNVLFKDGSAEFIKGAPTVGLGEDNIYTYGADNNVEMGGGTPEGTAPTGNGDGGPTGERDAYLVVEKNYQ